MIGRIIRNLWQQIVLSIPRFLTINQGSKPQAREGFDRLYLHFHQSLHILISQKKWKEDLKPTLRFLIRIGRNTRALR